MKMFNKIWFPLIAIGLMVGLAAPPGSALAGDLFMETKTSLIDEDEAISGDDLTASTEGTDGDPDTMTDDLNVHGNDLQELSGLGGLLEDILSSLDEVLVRMVPWLGLF